ncbi:hypothetical protein [Rhodoglobus aureus]|uniref:Uncharacterized protein n=1 Tax=Rhodoglobus aureus TaxID=191497 RepID=A0ABN1VXK8_9MICO
MTKTTKTTPQDYSDAQLTQLADAFESAWPGAAAQPAQMIDGFCAGGQPRLSQYGVLVAIAFEDEGFHNVFEMVAGNRSQTECAWNLGIMPCAFANYIINR